MAAMAGVAYQAYRGLKAARTDLTGKVVLITGGSRGLGFLMARSFGEERCRIVICARDESELEEARKTLAREGVEILAVPCDVTRRDQVARLIDAANERFGGIDILVNNASIIQVAPLEDLTHEDFEAAVDVNFWGTVHPTLMLLPHLRDRQGQIVNITSIGARIAVPHLLPYTCGKFAVYGFSEGLRSELKKDGVKVTTVVPGMMRTGSPMNAEFKGQATKEYGWFAAGAATPLTSIGGERAARKIVAATKRGQALLTLTTDARLLRGMHDIAPGTTTDLFGLVNRMLPKAGNDGTGKMGSEVADAGLNRTISRPIDHSARKYQQYSGKGLGPIRPQREDGEGGSVSPT